MRRTPGLEKSSTMENIQQAVERARAKAAAEPDRNQTNAGPAPRTADYGPGRPQPADTEEVVLNSKYLQSNRIISHLGNDPRARSFDMLRTQILHAMDVKGWKILAVTSPTPDCGKTVTALNLAISIARQPERAVLLVDLDLKKPRVAASLGLRVHDEGLLGVLKGQATLPRAVVQVRMGEQPRLVLDLVGRLLHLRRRLPRQRFDDTNAKWRFSVLPTTSTTGSSEIIASRAMAAMMQDLKRAYHSHIIIMDLPPLLTTDDTIAFLPQVDCVLLVTAVGSSTVAQIEECSRHLQSADVVRIVVNKVPETSTHYYHYY